MPEAIKYLSPIEVAAILAGRERGLCGLSYKSDGLAKTAIDVMLPEDMQFNESKMSCWLTFADGNQKDGVGDVTEVAGIHTAERHVKNPIVLFDHGQGKSEWSSWPIALTEDWDTKAYTVEIDAINRTARANCFFYQGTGLNDPSLDRSKVDQFGLLCEQAYDLLCKRYIRAGSFGYQVLRASRLPPDPSGMIPQGLHLHETLLLEISPVILPANANTVTSKGLVDEQLTELVCKGDCCGKRLSPWLVKSFEPYLAERKAQLFVETKSSRLPEEKPNYASNASPGVFSPNIPKPSVDSEPVGVGTWKPSKVSRARGRRAQQHHVGAVSGNVFQNSLPAESIGTKADDGLRRPKYKNPMSNPSIPPAAWDPGVGVRVKPNMKALRAKYRPQAGQGNQAPQPTQPGGGRPAYSRPQERGPYPQPKPSPNVSGSGKAMPKHTQGSGHGSRPRYESVHSAYEVGQKVTARKPINHLHEGILKPAAMPGEHLHITHVGEAGEPKRARTGSGHEVDVSVTDIRRTKAMSFNNPLQGGSLALPPAQGTSIKPRRVRRPPTPSGLKFLEVRNKGSFLTPQQPSYPEGRPEPRHIMTGHGNHHEGIVSRQASQKKPGKQSATQTAEIQGGYGKPLRNKGLLVVRKKYRSVKSVRRKVRGSVAGHATMHVKAEGLSACKQMAEEQGLEFSHLGPSGIGTEKVRLRGQDAAVDAVAKEHGIPMRRKVACR